MDPTKLARRFGIAYLRAFRVLENAAAHSSKRVYAAIFAPVLLAMIYVYLFGVNVVVGDQWEMVNYFSRLANDNLSAANLWMPHNEHRFFFPRMVMLSLGTLSGWNHVLEMCFILLCLLSVLATLMVAFRDGLGSRRLLFFVPIAFMVFSLKQWTNLLWGYQITFALTLASVVCALFLLHTALRRVSGRRMGASLYLAGAIAAAIVASGSSIQGLLVFPAGAVQFIVFSRRGFRWREAGVWGASGAVAWMFYFWNYNPRNDSPSSVSGILDAPFAAAQYFLSILGNALYSQPPILLFVGLMLLAAFGLAVALAWRSSRRSHYSFWFSLAAFSILTLLSVTVGRSGIGIESAYASRYTTFSIIGVASLYVILFELLVERQTWQRHVLFGTLALTVSLSLPLSFWSGIQAGIAEREAKEEAADALVNYRSQADAKLKNTLRNPPDSIRNRAFVLERLEYSSFSDETLFEVSGGDPDPPRNPPRNENQ